MMHSPVKCVDARDIFGLVIGTSADLYRFDLQKFRRQVQISIRGSGIRVADLIIPFLLSLIVLVLVLFLILVIVFGLLLSLLLSLLLLIFLLDLLNLLVHQIVLLLRGFRLGIHDWRRESPIAKMGGTYVKEVL